MHRRRTTAAIATVVVWVGCQAGAPEAESTAPTQRSQEKQEEQEVKSMSEEQVIARARAFAEEQGQAVERYQASASLDGESWYVNFTPKAGETPAPGDFFTVIIDEGGAGTPRLLPGK